MLTEQMNYLDINTQSALVKRVELINFANILEGSSVQNFSVV